jgi:2',5'-phosphodiesterase
MIFRLLLSSAASLAGGVFGAMATPTTTTSFRVVTYNVLSSHLASPSHYTTAKPEHLLASNRIEKILAKLDREIDPPATTNEAAASAPAAAAVVFCLQEVSYEFAGPIHTFFANRGFHVVSGLYGKPFNGYMGVITAWPNTAQLEVVSVHIDRLSDTAAAATTATAPPPSTTAAGAAVGESSSPSSFWPAPPPDSSSDDDGGVVMRLFKTVLLSPVQRLARLLLLQNQNDASSAREGDGSHWTMARNRFNVLVTIVLKDKRTHQQFCIGNYHMPCMYYAPMVM